MLLSPCTVDFGHLHGGEGKGLAYSRDTIHHWWIDTMLKILSFLNSSFHLSRSHELGDNSAFGCLIEYEEIVTPLIDTPANYSTHGLVVPPLSDIQLPCV